VYGCMYEWMNVCMYAANDEKLAHPSWRFEQKNKTENFNNS